MSRFLFLFRQAAASLANNVSFVATVSSTMGLTIGALLCVLTIWYLTVVQALPFPKPDNLYVLQHGYVESDGKINNRAYPYPTVMSLYEKHQTYEKLSLISYADDVLSSETHQPSVEVSYVSPEYFELLAPTVDRGRLFSESEKLNSYNPVAVITHHFWTKNFRSDPSVLDQTLLMSGRSFRIIGVLSSNFTEPEIAEPGRKTEIYLPWDFNQVPASARNTWTTFNRTIFLLVNKPDNVTVAQAELKSTSLLSPMWKEQVAGVDFFRGWDIKMELTPLKDVILRDGKRTVLLLIAGIVGLVLIAAGNITNLYFSRISKQQHKLTILASIGATRRNLFYTLLAESLLVMLVAILVALAFSQLGMMLAKTHLAQWLPRISEVHQSSFTVFVALAVMLLFAAGFAFAGIKLIDYRALAQSLKGSGKGTGVQVSAKIRKVMITAQVAIAATLIFYNLVIFHHAMGAITKPLGFNLDNISALDLSVNAPELPPRETIAPVIKQIRKGIEQLPQVKSVCQTFSPFRNFDIWVIDDVTNKQKYYPEGRIVDFNYFSMIGQPLVQGRHFTRAEVEDRSRLMIVNESFAERLAQNGPVLGAKLFAGDGDYFSVIGVVRNIQKVNRQDSPYQVYTPTHAAYTRFLIETHPGQVLDRATLASSIRESTSLFAVNSLESLQDVKDNLLFAEHISATVAASVAMLTVLLAGIGLIGIFSYGVQIRVFEIGTRLAVGARRKDIVRMMWKENYVSIFIGVLFSIAIVLCSLIFLRKYVDILLLPSNVVTYLVSVAMVVIIGWLSSMIPLRAVINRPVIHSLKPS